MGTVDLTPGGCSYDGTNTPWTGAEADKLYLQSGEFTSTLKTSESITGIDTAPRGISWDGVNTPWTGGTGSKLYLQSGQFTSTLKTSENIWAIDAATQDICTDDVNGRLGIGGASAVPAMMRYYRNRRIA